MTITAQEAVELLEDSVAKYGPGMTYLDRDGLYYEDEGTCRYVDELGTPCCLIGVVLIDHDLMTAADLEPVNSMGVVLAVGGLPGLGLSEGALLVWAAAQQVQDEGGTWGKALDKARLAAATNMLT